MNVNDSLNTHGGRTSSDGTVISKTTKLSSKASASGTHVPKSLPYSKSNFQSYRFRQAGTNDHVPHLGTDLKSIREEKETRSAMSGQISANLDDEANSDINNFAEMQMHPVMQNRQEYINARRKSSLRLPPCLDERDIIRKPSEDLTLSLEGMGLRKKDVVNNELDKFEKMRDSLLGLTMMN